jgi:hypothetical protein
MALEKNGQQLYAVAIEKLGRNGQPKKGKIFHIHAHDAAQAKMHYQVVFPDRRRFRIVDAALAIGFFINDKKGEDISAT